MTDHRISPNYRSNSESASGVNEDEFDIVWLFRVLWAGKFWIAAGVVAGIVLAYVYLAVAESTYSADALVQVRQSDSSGLGGIGGSSSGGGFGGAASLFGIGGSSAQGEIPIITSRSVLGSTVRELNLATTVTPDGGGLFSSPPPAPRIRTFDIPDGLRGRAFALAFTSARSYRLYGPSSNLILTGTVGRPAIGKSPDGEPVKVLIDDQSAIRSGAKFKVVKRQWLSATHNLNSDLTVDLATAGSNVLAITYTGLDQGLVAPIVNSIVTNYVEQNVASTTRDAGKSLGFLKKQLPKLNEQLKQAESRLADYEEKHQPVDLSSQGSALLSQSSSLASMRAQLEQRIAELRQTYTSNYPAVKAAERQLSQLGSQDTRLSKKINQLPGRQKDLLGLQRDVQVQTQLYTALLNRAQQMRVLQAGATGNIRVIDKAVSPTGRSSPRPNVVKLICILLGFMLAVAAILIREALRPGVIDSELLERHTGLDIFAIIPGVLYRRGIRRSARDASSVLTGEDRVFASTADALRRLRTRLHLVRKERGVNTLVVTSPASEVGSGFVATNLANLFARVGERVVVVDADMQGVGRADMPAGQNLSVGLSDYLSGKAQLEDILGRLSDTDISYINGGARIAHSSDFLMRAEFAELIDNLRSRFDFVVVKAPPVNAISDGTIVPSVLGQPLLLMVIGSNRHSMREIDNACEQLARQRTIVDGLVFTKEFARVAKPLRQSSRQS